MEEKNEKVTEEVVKVDVSKAEAKDNITKIDLNKPIEPKQ